VQCLNGELSPAVAIVRMLAVSHDVADVRAAIDHVTSQAAVSSRAGDNLVHDRADSLTQLFVGTHIRGTFGSIRRHSGRGAGAAIWFAKREIRGVPNARAHTFVPPTLFLP